MALGMPSARQLSRPGEYARVIAVVACQGRSVPAQKVSLFELCCGRYSRLSSAAAREGHAAIRIMRPRRWRPKRRGRRVSHGRGEYERAFAAALPAMRRRRVALFSVDVYKPHHRVRLLELLRMARPAPGTSACHLHVSFPCSAFVVSMSFVIRRASVQGIVQRCCVCGTSDRCCTPFMKAVRMGRSACLVRLPADSGKASFEISIHRQAKESDR